MTCPNYFRKVLNHTWRAHTLSVPLGELSPAERPGNHHPNRTPHTQGPAAGQYHPPQATAARLPITKRWATTRSVGTWHPGVALLVAMLSSTWPQDPVPVRQRRAVGQALTSAGRAPEKNMWAPVESASPSHRRRLAPVIRTPSSVTCLSRLLTLHWAAFPLMFYSWGYFVFVCFFNFLAAPHGTGDRSRLDS